MVKDSLIASNEQPIRNFRQLILRNGVRILEKLITAMRGAS